MYPLPLRNIVVAAIYVRRRHGSSVKMTASMRRKVGISLGLRRS
jgi:hypothetical protein